MFYYYIYLFFIIFLSSFVENIYTKDCDVHKLFEKCALNETCIESTNQCVCKANFVLDEKIGRCVLNDHLNEDHSPNVIPNHASTPTSSQDGSVSGSSVAAGILVPLTLIAVAVGIFYAERRYNWIHRIRRMRHSRYDEVHIGREDDDDPPIA